jgi:hypothetical protein
MHIEQKSTSVPLNRRVMQSAPKAGDFLAQRRKAWVNERGTPSPAGGTLAFVAYQGTCSSAVGSLRVQAKTMNTVSSKVPCQFPDPLRTKTRNVR